MPALSLPVFSAIQEKDLNTVGEVDNVLQLLAVRLSELEKRTPRLKNLDREKVSELLKEAQVSSSATITYNILISVAM